MRPPIPIDRAHLFRSIAARLWTQGTTSGLGCLLGGLAAFPTVSVRSLEIRCGASWTCRDQICPRRLRVSHGQRLCRSTAVLARPSLAAIGFGTRDNEGALFFNPQRTQACGAGMTARTRCPWGRTVRYWIDAKPYRFTLILLAHTAVVGAILATTARF